MMDEQETDTPLSAIDPGEALMSAIGVRPAITRKVERITAAQFRTAIDLPKSIHKLARSMVRGELEQTKLETQAYKPLLDELMQDYGEDQIVEMIAPAPPDAKMPFMTVAYRAFMYLQARLPRSVYKSFAGTRNLIPDDPAYYQFLGIFQVLDNPLCVFSLIQYAMLLKSQREAIREIYPTLCDAIDYEIQQASDNERAQKKSFELSLYAELGMRTWNDNPVNLKPLQASYLEENKKPVTSNEPDEVGALDSLSTAQKTLYQSVR